jgi:hypothetical protein
MRSNGVRTLAVHCDGRFCHHGAVLDVSETGDDVPVPAFRPRMVCTVCGAIGADARPNWNERAPACKSDDIPCAPRLAVLNLFGINRVKPISRNCTCPKTGKIKSS